MALTYYIYIIYMALTYYIYIIYMALTLDSQQIDMLKESMCVVLVYKCYVGLPNHDLKCVSRDNASKQLL